MAVGGAAGALKGAALGAAVGSVVPVVGTVIGGAIGAGLGAIGGSYLGGKAGEFIGEKFGKVKNFFFGKSGESDKVKKAEVEKGSSVEIEFSEMAFAKNDPENYKNFRTERDALADKYANDSFKKHKARGGKRTEPDSMDYRMGKMKADQETIQKYRNEIEAAGAGKVTGGKIEEPKAPGEKTADALKKTAEGVTGDTPKVTGSATGDVIGDTSEGRLPFSSSSPVTGSATGKVIGDTAPNIAPPAAPQTGNTIAKQSGDNEQAKLDSGKGGGNSSIVAAPTINNNNNVQNTPVKLAPRNGDSTVNKYMQSRWAY
jgi:hypothetical protein